MYSQNSSPSYLTDVYKKALKLAKIIPLYKGDVQTIKINIDNQPIDEKTKTKYLCVIIDNKLSWKEHIKEIDCKLRKGKTRDFVPQSVLKSLYYSFILPYVDYNILNWSSTYTTNL